MTTFTLLILSLFSLISQKNNVEPDKSSPLVKSYTSLDFSGFNGTKIITYQYGGNRLTKEVVENLDNTSQVKKIESITTYNYHKDSIISITNNFWTKVILNDQALSIKHISPNEFAQDQKLTTHLQHSYNKEGNMIEKIVFNDYVTYSYKTIFTYIYNSGNLIKEIRTEQNTDENGSVSKRVTHLEYEYYTDKLNTIGNSNFGQEYLGKSSKNLVKSAKTSWGTVFYYQYEFDKENKVVSKATFNENNVKFEEYHYEYYK